MRISKVILSIVSILVLSTMLVSIGASALTASEIKQKIEQAKKQKKDAQKKVDAIAGQQKDALQEKKEIDSDIGDIQENIDLIEGNISTKERAIQENLNAIEEENKKLDTLNEQFKERVRVMYEQGTVSYLEVLLGSKDITDFLSRLTMVNDIVKHDKHLMKTFSDAKLVIASKKAENEKQKAELEESKQMNQEQKSDMQSKLNKQDQILSSLQKDKEKYNRLIEIADKVEDDANKALTALIAAEQAKSKRTFSGGKFAWPLSSGGTVTCAYGYRTDPKPGFHKGVDISDGRIGTPVLAANDGVVITSGYNNGGYGNYVIIDHGGGIATLYAHFSKIYVSSGQDVKRGDKIGAEGSTGFSTGAHLHFEVIVNGKNVNPMEYIR